MKKIIVIILIAAIIFGGYRYYRYRKEAASAKEDSYLTHTVSRGNITIKVLSTGALKPFTRVSVTGGIRGRVEEVRAKEGDFVERGDILAVISGDERNSLLDAAKAQLETAYESENTSRIQNAREAFQIAENAYKTVSITSSIDGEIIQRSVEPGQNIDPNSELFVLADRLIAKVDVDEVDIAKIKKGLEAVIVLDAYPDERIRSEVSRIAREGRRISDVVVYGIDIEPESLPGHWAPGMTANVEFIIEQKKNILTVPRSALVQLPRDGKSKGDNNKNKRGTPAGIRVLENDELVEKKIFTGITDGRMIEVISGLEEGDEVVTGTLVPGESLDDDNSKRGMRMRL
ncbi:MAG: efflux RND transporter periplasmic adaptor subunit [Candidatus Muiribacteriota bacterium]